MTPILSTHKLGTPKAIALGGRMSSSRTRTFRVAASLSLALSLAVPIVAPPPARAATGCVDFLLLGSRGSGEEKPDPAKHHSGLGSTLDKLSDFFRSDVAPRGATYDVWANPYDAVPVSGSWRGYLNDLLLPVPVTSLSPYRRSLSQGEQYLTDKINTFTAGSCASTTKLILAGYSQGAQATATVYQNLVKKDPGLRSKILGVALFGDPEFRGRSVKSLGNYDPSRNGIFAVPPRPEYQPTDNVLSYCHSKDPVCQGLYKLDWFIGPVLSFDIDQHTNYVSVGDAVGKPTYPQLAANTLANRAGFRPKPAGPPLDLVFALDSTGSMAPYLSSVTAGIQEIAAQARAASPDMRIALVDFKDTDQGDPYASQVDVPFTTDVSVFGATLNEIAATGGGDGPEARYSGIMTALDLPWRPGVRKEVIAMTDAPGKDPEPVTGFTSASVVAKAFAVDPAVIDTLAVGGDSAAAAFAPEVTTSTGGHLFAGDDPGTVAATIIEAIQATTTAPSATITPPGAVGAGGTYSLSAAGSFDPSGDQLTFAWDLDGSNAYATTSPGPILTDIPAGGIGDHPVSVRVKNSNGQVAYATATVHVVAAGPYTGTPGAPTAVVATRLADKTGVTLSWQPPSSGPPTEQYEVFSSDGFPLALITHGGAGSVTLPASVLPVTAQIQSINRVGAGGVSGAVAIAGFGPAVTRIAGVDRFDTGIRLSQRRWNAGQAAAVVLARGDAFPDALAGVPLAAKKGGPLLLTSPTVLNSEVATEIQRVLPKGGTVYVLGGLGAISQSVQDSLTRSGYKVVRFGGTDRFDTALIIAKSPNAMGDPAHVIVATGLNYPDALTAGPFAAGPFAAGGQPAAIVLSQDKTLGPATAAYVASKLPGSTSASPNVAAIGGQAVTAVGAVLPRNAYQQLSGADRYATAVKTADAFTSPSTVGVATGTAFPDALTGGAYMASISGPILLTDPAALSGPTASRLTTFGPSISTVDVFGGARALPDAILQNIAQVVHGTVK
jgi:hypothetical protein